MGRFFGLFFIVAIKGKIAKRSGNIYGIRNHNIIVSRAQGCAIMVLKLKKKVGGIKSSKVPINKAHLLKVQKLKKLRHAVKAQDIPEDDTNDIEALEQQDEPQEVPSPQTNIPTEPQTQHNKNPNKRKAPETPQEIKPTSPPLQEASPKSTAPDTVNKKKKKKKKSKNEKASTQQTATQSTENQPQQKKQKATPINKTEQTQPKESQPQQKDKPITGDEDEDMQHIPTTDRPRKEIQKAGEYYVLPFRFAKKGSVVRQLLLKHDTVNNVLHILLVGEDRRGRESLNLGY